MLEKLVRLHLLLPDVATRRDLEDPATLKSVAEAVGDETTLELLRCAGRSRRRGYRDGGVDAVEGAPRR